MVLSLCFLLLHLAFPKPSFELNSQIKIHLSQLLSDTLARMKMKRPTQADVAEQAGVSRATVSYVLNDQESRVPISPQTRERVLEVIGRLGYEPDARAQSLRSGDSKTIGLLIPDIHNPHYWQMIDGIEEETHRAGYDLILAHSSVDKAREEYCIKALSRRTMSGLIIVTTQNVLEESLIERLRALGRPVVGINAPGFDNNVTNYRSGTREVLKHLLELGHKRFAFINGVADMNVGSDRLEVYVQVLRQKGLPETHRLVENCGFEIEDGYQAAYKILSRNPRPTALVVINDLLAMGAIRAANDLGLQIPKDVSVASFDDLPISSYLVPRLTTVRRDNKAIGRAMTKLLLERLKNPKRPPQRLELSTKLIIRESTGPVSPKERQRRSRG
jgi:LacI family transcriptional regulator